MCDHICIITYFLPAISNLFYILLDCLNVFTCLCSRECSARWCYSITMVVWWSETRVLSGNSVVHDMTLIPQKSHACLQKLASFTVRLLHFFIPLAAATEWCDSREQTMSGSLVIWGRKDRSIPGLTASLPPHESGASPADDSPGFATEVDDPNLSKTEGGGRGRGRVIRGRGWLCLRQWHSLIGRCPCPWHE